jgi:arabinofuranosyltransferase
MSNRAARLLSLICISDGLAIFTLGAIDSANFTVDDSFISLRFAENWASGHGPVFNPGEQVEGYSSFLWTGLLTLLAKLGITQQSGDLNLLIAAKIAGMLFGFATLLLLAWIADRMWRLQLPGSRVPLTIAVVGLGSTYTFTSWAVSGMETAMCAFFVTLAAGLMMTALRRTDETDEVSVAISLGAGIAFGLLTLVRPEQIFVWVLAMAGLFVIGPRSVRRVLLLAAIPTLLIHAGLVAWRFSYYGSLLPNTVVAKSGGGLLYMLLGAKYVLAGLVGTVGILGVGWLAIPQLFRTGTDRRFLIFYVIGFLVFIGVSGGDWMPGYRFFAPVLPLLWLLTALGFLSLVARALPRVSPAVVTALVCLLCAASFLQGRDLIRAELEYPTGIKQLSWTTSPERMVAAKELSGIVPPGATLAIGECGFVPYYAPEVRIFDVFGLMTPEIAGLPGLHTEKLTVRAFLEEHPGYYLMMVKETATHDIVPTHHDGRLLLASPAFHSRYEILRRFPGFILYRSIGEPEQERQPMTLDQPSEPNRVTFTSS